MRNNVLKNTEVPSRASTPWQEDLAVDLGLNRSAESVNPKPKQPMAPNLRRPSTTQDLIFI